MQRHVIESQAALLLTSLSRLSLPALRGALWLGCGGTALESHNLGNTADDTAPLATPTPITLSAFEGTWIGEAEDPLAPQSGAEPPIYHFPSGSTQIRFQYTWRDSASIAFGEGDPLPPPTDFDVGYPPGVDYKSTPLWGSGELPPVEGYAYALAINEPDGPVAAADAYPNAITDGVLRFSYLQNEIFDDWCSAQAPVSSGALYSCAGGGSYSTGGDACFVGLHNVPADCGKLYLCDASPQPPCKCTAEGCDVNPEPRPSLFLRRVGDELFGALSGAVFLNAAGPLMGPGQLRFHHAE